MLSAVNTKVTKQRLSVRGQVSRTTRADYAIYGERVLNLTDVQVVFICRSRLGCLVILRTYLISHLRLVVVSAFQGSTVLTCIHHFHTLIAHPVFARVADCLTALLHTRVLDVLDVDTNT